MFLNAVINGSFQVIIFGLIPFIWWLVTARKKENFFSWIGFKKPKAENMKNFLIKCTAVFAAGFVIGEVLVYLQGDVEAAQSQYAGMGLMAVPSGIVYALIQTSLSEEILFRGFLLKRLSAKLGFKIANFIQGVIFGVLHLVLLWGNVAPWYLVLAVLYPMGFAMALGWLDEKEADGSIYPSWCIHALGNIISQLLAIF